MLFVFFCNLLYFFSIVLRFLQTDSYNSVLWFLSLCLIVRLYHNLFPHSPVLGYLYCFHVFLLVCLLVFLWDTASVNILDDVFLDTCTENLLGVNLVRELLSVRACVFSAFLAVVKLLSWMVVPLILLSMVIKSSWLHIFANSWYYQIEKNIFPQY